MSLYVGDRLVCRFGWNCSSIQTCTPNGIMVSAGKLRKLMDSLSELRSSLCERRLERTVLEACSIVRQNCAIYSVLPSDVTSHCKIVQFNWECIRGLRLVNFIVKWLVSI